MGQIKKQIKGKVVFKHETEEIWDGLREGYEPVQYIPDKGEQVLYEPDNNYSYTRVKYGDGEHIVAELPFGGATFDDDVDIVGQLSVNGQATIHNKLEVGGDVSISGNLTVSGDSIQQEGCISGGRAYRFSKVTYNSDGTGIFSLVDKDGNPLTSLEDAPYTLNQYYSYIINAGGKNAKQDFVGKITKVEIVGGTVCVYVSALGTVTSTIVVGKLAKDDPSECLFIAPQNPSIGDIEIGQGAITLGFNNTNLGTISFVSGEANLNTGHYALIGGKKNIGGYGSLIGGRDNFAVSNYSVAGGSNHTVTGLRSAAFNLKNTASHQNCTVVGSYNITTADNQLVGGRCANPSTTSLFTIGNGSSTGSRSNAFEVLSSDTKKSIVVGGKELTSATIDNLNGVSKMIDGSNKRVTLSNQTSLTPSALTIENRSLTTSSIDGLNNIISNIEIKNHNIRFKDPGNTATASYGVSLGLNTSVGSGSLATGRNSKALAFASAALGDGLVVPAHYTKGTTALGIFNDYDAENNPNVIFMVGNGSSDTARSNAFEVRKNGAVVSGIYANPSTGALLTIGNGTSDTKRSNAFEVISTASKKAIKVGNAELTSSTVQSLNTLNNALDTHVDEEYGIDRLIIKKKGLSFDQSSSDHISYKDNNLTIYNNNDMSIHASNNLSLYGEGSVDITAAQLGVSISGREISLTSMSPVAFNSNGIKIGETTLNETQLQNLNTLNNVLDPYVDDEYGIDRLIIKKKALSFDQSLDHISYENGHLTIYNDNDMSILASSNLSLYGEGSVDITAAQLGVSISGREISLTSMSPVAFNSNGITIGGHILTADKLKKILDFIDTIE